MTLGPLSLVAFAGDEPADERSTLDRVASFAKTSTMNALVTVAIVMGGAIVGGTLASVVGSSSPSRMRKNAKRVQVEWLKFQPDWERRLSTHRRSDNYWLKPHDRVRSKHERYSHTRHRRAYRPLDHYKDPESVDAQMDRLMYHERQAR